MDNEKIIDAYIDFELMNGREPHSVYEFGKSIELEEDTFYKAFSSLPHLRKQFLGGFISEVLTNIDEDENYQTFTSREKLLTVFFTLFEKMKSKRSYILMRYGKSNPTELQSISKDFDTFFQVFTNRVDLILGEGKSSEEVKDRPYIGEHYAKGFKLVFLYVFRVWIKDESEDFEVTDAAIEKTVNLAYEMLGHSPLDSIIDFGKFVFKTKIF